MSMHEFIYVAHMGIEDYVFENSKVSAFDVLRKTFTVNMFLPVIFLWGGFTVHRAKHLIHNKSTLSSVISRRILMCSPIHT